MTECQLERLAIIQFDGNLTPTQAMAEFKRQIDTRVASKVGEDAVERLKRSLSEAKMRRAAKRFGGVDVKSKVAGE